MSTTTKTVMHGATSHTAKPRLSLRREKLKSLNAVRSHVQAGPCGPYGSGTPTKKHN